MADLYIYFLNEVKNVLVLSYKDVCFIYVNFLKTKIEVERLTNEVPIGWYMIRQKLWLDYKVILLNFQNFLREN